MFNAKLVLVSCVAIVSGLLAGSAASGSIPHTNYLTFTAPFALPGVSLPAGTYVFDVLETGSDNVVRVTNRDRSRTYMTAFTVTVQRPKVLPVSRQIVFDEVAAGMTPPVKTWYPVGQSIGHQFIYDAVGRQLDAAAAGR